MNDLYKYIDEAMVPLHEQVNAMLDITGDWKDEESGSRLQVEQVNIESPVQLDIVVDETGNVAVGSSPPLYYMDTDILPVFHNIRIKIVKEEVTKVLVYNNQQE